MRCCFTSCTTRTSRITWQDPFSIPELFCAWRPGPTYQIYIFSRATLNALNETFTAKYDGVLRRTPQVRQKSEIYTPKQDDEHPHPFHMRSLPPPPPPGGLGQGRALGNSICFVEYVTDSRNPEARTYRQIPRGYSTKFYTGSLQPMSNTFPFIYHSPYHLSRIPLIEKW